MFSLRTDLNSYFLNISIFSLHFFEIDSAFNIDLSKAVIYQGTKGSMFGFTVAGYKHNGKNGILVGAPKNRDKQFSRIEPQYQGGSLYFCNLDLLKNKHQRSKCEEIKFPIDDNEDYESLSDPTYIEQQWLGASLVTSEFDGTVAVCAPRSYKILKSIEFDVSYPVGVCYYSKQSLKNFIKYVPNELGQNYPNLYSDFASQAGFSLTLSKDSTTFYSGAVSALVFNSSDSYGYLLGLNMDNEKYIKIPDPIKLPSLTTNSYFGYAVASLNFYGTKQTGVAITAPKAEQLRGKVIIFTSSFSTSNSKELIGQQFAAYFGYSICTADMDGDGADDLIIGAPLYSHNFNSLNELYESGRIYVYYQGKVECSRDKSMCWDERFNRFDHIDGEYSKGRFGFTIASLGDINRDGFGDIAVSAPYEESFENCPQAACTGAVYIYHGSKQGISKKYSQVLRASDVYHQNQMKTLSLKSFGFSLHGGMDFDGNSDPDLVVGASESDVVFLFFI